MNILEMCRNNHCTRPILLKYLYCGIYIVGVGHPYLNLLWHLLGVLSSLFGTRLEIRDDNFYHLGSVSHTDQAVAVVACEESAVWD